MISVFAAFASEDSKVGKLKSDASPAVDTNCTVLLLDVLRDRTNGFIRKRRSFPNSGVLEPSTTVSAVLVRNFSGTANLRQITIILNRKTKNLLPVRPISGIEIKASELENNLADSSQVRSRPY